MTTIPEGIPPTVDPESGITVWDEYTDLHHDGEPALGETRRRNVLPQPRTEPRTIRPDEREYDVTLRWYPHVGSPELHTVHGKATSPELAAASASHVFGWSAYSDAGRCEILEVRPRW